MWMRHLILATLMSFASVAASKPVIDVMFAFDQTAAAWMDANDKDVSVFVSAAVERMNSVLPATGLDECFSFRLAGTFVSQAAASAELVGQERLAAVLMSVSSASGGVASGAWKDIQSARDQHKADVVVVLVDTGLESSSGVSVGGVSWCMGDPKPAKLTDFAKWAYSVCGVQEVEAGYIVLHEVGHLMGAGHSDRLEESPGPQLFGYSSAWYTTDAFGDRYYTIMGYPYLSETDYGYRPYPAFSSASHTMEDGTPLGDATHDNTRTLRETCTSVAQFHISGDDGLPASAAFTSRKVVNAQIKDADGRLCGLVQMTVAKTDKKGFSKVSAAYYGLDGKKKLAKAVKASVLLVNDVPTVQDVALTVKGESDPLQITIGADGAVSGRLGDCSVEGVESVGVFSTGTPRFVLAESFATLGGFPVINDVSHDGTDYHLLPDGDGVGFSVNGKKLAFAKTAVVKYVKDKATGVTSIRVNTGKSGEKTNLCGLKLSVNAKTGVFKGSFVAYADVGTAEKPKLKKYKFTVTGLLADGRGTGQAVSRNAGVFSVSLRE